MAGKDVERLRKITVKAIGASPDFEKLMAAQGKKMDLCDIYGVATRTKPGQTDLGPYVAFLGQFRAVNIETKQVYESGKLLLPKFMEEELYGAMGQNNGADASAGAVNVEFAIRLSAKFDKDSATKYVYDARSIIPPKENAQFSALESRVKESVKALPAPK